VLKCKQSLIVSRWSLAKDDRIFFLKRFRLTTTTSDQRRFRMRAFAQPTALSANWGRVNCCAAYVFVGDEAFFRKRFRDAILEHLGSRRLARILAVRIRPRRDDLAEGSGPRPYSLAHGSVPGFLRARCENLFGVDRNDEKLAPSKNTCRNPILMR